VRFPHAQQNALSCAAFKTTITSSNPEAIHLLAGLPAPEHAKAGKRNKPVISVHIFPSVRQRSNRIVERRDDYSQCVGITNEGVVEIEDRQQVQGWEVLASLLHCCRQNHGTCIKTALAWPWVRRSTPDECRSRTALRRIVANGTPARQARALIEST
jgi:hypothetical protein